MREAQVPDAYGQHEDVEAPGEDDHGRLADEHDEVAEHWATRGHLNYAADHRRAAMEERVVAQGEGTRR